MLRILPAAADTRDTGGVVARVQLVGQIGGRWVDELRRVCIEHLRQSDRLEIDMAEVSFVDAEGLRLFRDMPSDRVSIVNCALFVAEQLRTLQEDVEDARHR